MKVNVQVAVSEGMPTPSALEHLMHSPSILCTVLATVVSQFGTIALSTSSATFSPTVSLTALRMDHHSRGCSPVPGPRDSHSWNMARHACLTLWGLSARMVSRTAAPTSKNNPTSYHQAAILHTTRWLSSLSVGVERRGLSGASEQPACTAGEGRYAEYRRDIASSAIHMLPFHCHVGVCTV